MREYFSTPSYFAFGISTVVSNKDDITMCLWIYLFVFHDVGSSLLQAGLRTPIISYRPTICLSIN